MVTQFCAPFAVDGGGIDAIPELVTQVNEFLESGRWSPEVVAVQFDVTPLGAPGVHSQVLVQAFVTHPAPSR